MIYQDKILQTENKINYLTLTDLDCFPSTFNNFLPLSPIFHICL